MVRAGVVEQAAWTKAPGTLTVAPLHSSALRAQTQGQWDACIINMHAVHWFCNWHNLNTARFVLSSCVVRSESTSQRSGRESGAAGANEDAEAGRTAQNREEQEQVDVAGSQTQQTQQQGTHTQQQQRRRRRGGGQTMRARNIGDEFDLFRNQVARMSVNKQIKRIRRA